MTKPPAGQRIVFPRLGLMIATSSLRQGMRSWEYVYAITLLLARCANLAESLSTNDSNNRRLKIWTSRLQNLLGLTPSASNQTMEEADARKAAPAGVSSQLRALCNELVDGGNELGKAISKRSSGGDWQSGRFPRKRLPATYGAMKAELEVPMKEALDNNSVVDAAVVVEWKKSAKRLIQAAMQDTKR